MTHPASLSLSCPLIILRRQCASLLSTELEIFNHLEGSSCLESDRWQSVFAVDVVRDEVTILKFRFSAFSADGFISNNRSHFTQHRKYRLSLYLFRMMNEGLDALATLASTSPSAPAWGDSGPNNNNCSSQRTNGNPFYAHGANGNASTSTSNGSTAAAAAAPADSHPLFSASNLTQMLQNGSLSQYQQALQQCGNGMNPSSSSLSNNNLALLMGMQQRQSQPQPQADQLALLQQQLSYYRCNNLNSQSGNQMNASTGNREVQQANTTSFEPHQALALFQALQAHQRAQQNGRSPI
jgi:hypothetical protein